MTAPPDCGKFGWRLLERRLRLLARCRGGAAAVEFALCAPALFLFIFGIAEMGRMLWVQNALSYAVAQAARCAANDSGACGSATDTQNFAATSSGYAFSAAVFTATTASCGNRVSASYPVSLAIPFISVSVTLTALACYPS